MSCLSNWTVHAIAHTHALKPLFFTSSLRASFPFGGYGEKWTCDRHARGDAEVGVVERKDPRPARSRVLARLPSLSQIGELARRLFHCQPKNSWNFLCFLIKISYYND